MIRDPKNGRPFDRYRWSKGFRINHDAAGLPATVWMMDTRAAAITDAKRAGASRILMQHQATHASADTTSRYIREKSDSISQVLQMRRAAHDSE